MRLRESEQLKTTLTLCTRDGAQEGDTASYTCLKILKKYLEHKTRDRNFDARNDQIASGALVKQKVSVKLSLSVSVCQFVSPSQSLSISVSVSRSVGLHVRVHRLTVLSH